MNRYKLLFFIAVVLLMINGLILPSFVKAQINCAGLASGTYTLCDDFTDGNFSDTPTWAGDIAQFSLNALGQLQAASAGTDTIALSTAIADANQAIWQFYFRLGFAPSANNNLRVYLIADQADLKGSLNGYYLQMGENGSLDAIELYKQVGTTATLVMRGADATVADNPAYYVKIVRNIATGQWQIYLKPEGGGSYGLDSEATDNTLNLANGYLGVWCKHTSTNSTKFYFDDFYVGDEIVDNTPPTVLSAVLDDPQNITLTFSEALNAVTAQNTANYTLNLGVGAPTSAMLDAGNAAIVHLSLGSPLLAAQTYTLQVSGLQDLAGNIMSASASFNLSYFLPQAGSVIITELLADYDPSVGLPTYEFVEVYNTTNFDVNLNGWHITDNFGSNPGAILPNINLPAHTYMVLCSSSPEAVSAYQALGGLVAGLSSFPSLNNSGDVLTLTDTQENIIDQVSYSDDWITDDVKRAGGWSLELINLQATCQTAANWHESIALIGGTPGSANSVAGLFGDTQAPQFLFAEANEATSVSLNFNEPLDENSASDAINYSISGGITITSVTVESPTSVTLWFSQPLQEGVIYTITAGNMTDCMGNVTTIFTTQVALPQTATPYNVLITEIYADTDAPDEYNWPQPRLPEAQYIELFNRSDKTISLKNWTVFDAADTATIEANFLLLPQQYVVVGSAADADLLANLGVPFLAITSFPQPNTTGDILGVANANGLLIYAIQYEKSWYRDDRKEEGQWSLEMIDTNNPCEGAANWRASEADRGGTPGALNSVAGPNPDQKVPDLLRAEVIASTAISLYFNETLDLQTASNTANYTINSGAATLTISSAVPVAPLYREVLLYLSTPVLPATVYNLQVNLVSDCGGNPVGIYHTAKVGIPESAEPNDVIINELLFNPKGDGYDYVELYNRSNKIVSLDSWFIANALVDANPDSLINFTPLTNGERFTLFPDSYVALTENPDWVQATYGLCGRAISPQTLLKADLPSMNDDEGVVAIVDLTLTDTLDKVHYYDSWHYALLDNVDGAALERINYNNASQDKNNWQSAASTFCYGTPGYKNSQFFVAGNAEENAVLIDPPSFSPDNDGYNDAATINYTLDGTNYTIDIMIYDERGREVTHLVKNEVAGPQGYYKWDGIADNGEKATVGIYVVRAQFFAPDGKVKSYRKTVVLAGKTE